MQTDGFEFVEFTSPQPVELGRLFETLGFTAVARHRSKNVTLYRQGDVHFILNAERECFPPAFTLLHGPSVCAIASRVHDPPAAGRRAPQMRAWAVDSPASPLGRTIPPHPGLGLCLPHPV